MNTISMIFTSSSLTIRKRLYPSGLFSRTWCGLGLALLFVLVGFVGCASDGSYREEHLIQNLNVVFVDQGTLHQEWRSRTGTEGVQLGPSYGGKIPLVKTLRGFYDFTNRTLYCPKWNFAVCGHELHHAVLGHFHDKE